MTKPSLILIGGGGHCKSCIDVIEQENKFLIAGIVDTNRFISELLGYPLLGNDDDLAKLKLNYDYALITIGQIKTPAIRIRLLDYAKSLGFKLPAIISPRAYVSKHAKIGNGTIIMHDATSKGAINYLNLAREVLQKNNMTRLSDEEKIINNTQN